MTQETTTTPQNFVKKTVAADESFFGYYPGAVAVVTSCSGADVNVMSAGWHTALSEAPPLYGVAVAPGRHSYGLIRASSRFVVNFLPFANAEAVAGAGLLSGLSVPDKLERLGLEWDPGEAGAPILRCAWMSYECRVRDEFLVGDHSLFVGEVLRLHYREDAFDGRLLASDRLPAIAYYGRSTYEALGQGERKVLPPELYRETGRSGER